MSARSQIVERAGRRVVLKPLDDDCLLDGDLHPTIRLRLSRVRELPMTAVANLHGVERIDGRAVLIWDYVEGRTLAELSERERTGLRDEVRLITETLHSFGIVHGALHERNTIVDERGGVHLTHLSPLLHSDFEQDLRAIDAMFHSTRPLTPTLSRRERGQDTETSVRAVVGAVVALVLGVAIAATVIWYSSFSS